MEPYARAYYGALMLNELDRTHRPLFEAFHLKKQNFSTAQDFAELFVSKGVDGDAFTRAYNSFGMTSMVNQAKARVRSYRVQGTPEMVINGKYRISTRKAGGFAGMLSVADFLIEKERAENAKK
jgi:thiol:disulfide interchange protein DsbA